jgi:hypothetical protein
MRNVDPGAGAGEGDMSMDRLLPLEAAAADALLDGRGDGPPELVALLARATAPGHPVELFGEAVAVAHLRATPSVLTSPHPPATRRGFLSRGFSIKAAAAAAVAVLVVGGVAIAATVGASPEGIGGSGRGAVGSSASQGAGAAATGPNGATPAGAHSTGPTKAGAPSAVPSASPSSAANESLPGLCQAYQKAVPKNPKVLENKGYARLITAAGGRDKVPQFCADLLDDAAGTSDQDSQGENSQDENSAGRNATPTPQPGGAGASGDE